VGDSIYIRSVSGGVSLSVRVVYFGTAIELSGGNERRHIRLLGRALEGNFTT
jgi:hypothetical protein